MSAIISRIADQNHIKMTLLVSGGEAGQEDVPAGGGAGQEDGLAGDGADQEDDEDENEEESEVLWVRYLNARVNFDRKMREQLQNTQLQWKRLHLAISSNTCTVLHCTAMLAALALEVGFITESADVENTDKDRIIIYFVLTENENNCK